MDDIIEIKTQLADHEARIKNVEIEQGDIRENIRNTNRLISEMETRTNQNMRDVRDELKEELKRMTLLVQDALKKKEKKLPDWGRYLIEALSVVASASLFVVLGSWMGKVFK